MKRRIIAALMALCLCIGLLPATALAAGDIYEGNDTFYYHITDSSLANMVAAKRPEGSSSEVSRVTITFNEDYSAGEQNTFVFRNGYTIALSNVSDSVQPDDIAYLTISFVDSESIRIEQNELNWTWVSSLPRRYDLRLATDDNTCTVTFYYQPGDTVDNSAWQVYREVPVEKGTSLGNLMPALPNEGTAHWVAWETGSNNGTGAEFTADTIVNSDLTVYARKVTSGAGSEYHIMNPDNSLLEAVLELYLDDYPDSEVTTDDVQISRISVVGSEDSTNPNYSPVGTSYGWQEGTSWYWIYNLENHTLPEGGSYWNDRVPPNDIQSITIYATVDGNEETYSISRSELDVRVRSNVIIEIYLRDTNDEEEDTPPDAPDKDTVIDLAGENAVAVKCTTNTDHQQDTSELSAESITVGSVVSNGEGGYTCTITVAPDSYVTAYNGTYSGHRLDPTGQTGEILLVHDGENWVIAGEAPYVTFTVSCGTDYAIDGFTKKFVDSTDERAAAEAAGIDLGGYDFPNTDGKVIIPEEEDATVTLLYAITVEGKPGASFTVTDEDATLVAIGSVAITQTDDTFTGSIPADAASITFYVSKTFDADNLESASEGDGTVLKNTATVAGNADPNEDEDTEETPAEEEDPTKPDFDDDVLAGVTVQVLCVQKPTDHKYVSTLDQHPEAYETKIEPCADDEKVNGVLLPDGFDWKCTVSISKEYFVKYFNDVAKLQSNLWGEHELAESEKTTEIVLYYGSDGWELLGSTSSVIIQVKEKSTGTYTLTYDANGGTINGEDTWSKEVARGLVTLASVDGYNAPIHAQEELDGKLVDVAFVGWSTTDSDTIYEAGQALPDTVTTVTISGNTTVYAVWGYDTNGDKVADATQVLITPADIIIYEGGTGYEAVVENPDDATAVPGVGGEESTGLPEPGFYITLPYEINNALKEQAEEDENINDKKVVNLSEYLTFNYSYGDTERTWKLALYDSDGASHLDDGRYIYRILPAEVDQDGDGTISEDEKIPIRLLFTDENNNETTSDDFTFSASDLYAEFQMTIYDGGLEQNLVTASVQNVDGAQDLDVGVGTGTLTIRGVREENPENAVSEIVTGELLEPVTDITAQAEEGVTYYVNDSPLAVENQDKVQLLADKLADTPEALTDAAEDAIKAKLENPEYDFMYLDLVDSSNGNAYVTLGDDDTITIHWPIPGDAKEGSAFYVVHFDGLDRDYDVDTELEGLLTDENITVYEKDGTNDLTVSEDGKSVSFETSTFSPFALVYEQKDGTTPVTKYTVTYDANGGKGAMASQTVNAGNSVTIKANTFTRSDHTFTGWNTRADGTGTGYAAGNTITPNSNLTLYAQWKSTGDSGYDPKEATLRFNSRGGTEFDDIVRDDPFEYNPYNKIPTRPGYRFTGWYDSSRLDDRYDEDEEISVPMGITTVWAGWEETSVPSMLNGDDHYAYIQGYSDGTVRPNANITRAQVATIFFRLLDEDVRDDNLTTYNTFPDVDEDYWANTAISTMASLGVINGRNSGLFDPDAYITRAEFAAICARFDDSGVDGITTFTDTVGHWAEDEISRAAALGWIQGYADGTFRPNQYITRAQAVTMINRVLCRLPEDTDDLLSGMNTWTDCHEDDWFYLAIQEATNSHDFVAKDRVYESWTDLNRAPDWSRYE